MCVVGLLIFYVFTVTDELSLKNRERFVFKEAKIMNFDDAVKAHSAWKMKLSGYIRNPDGSLDPKAIQPDNLCDLGKWIYQSASDHADLEEYKKLKECHAKFHKCAADIVTRADKGEKLTDEIALGSNSDYAKLSLEVVGLIMTMKKKVSG